MKTIFYTIGRLFFSKEKLLLIRLLNEIQDTLIRFEDGTVIMKNCGMCSYISDITKDKDYFLLRNLLYTNRPNKIYRDGMFFFEPFNYELRYEFLKDLIKKY
jgi:hypothetical protein